MAPDGAGNQPRKVVEVTPVHRQLQHLGVLNHGADRTFFRRQQGSDGGHFHRLGDLPDHELEVLAQRLRDVELDLVHHLTLEPLRGHLDAVEAGDQGTHRVVAGGIGGGGAADVGLHVGHLDGGVGNRGSRRVHDAAQDSPERRGLSGQTLGKGQNAGEKQDQPSQTDAVAAHGNLPVGQWIGRNAITASFSLSRKTPRPLHHGVARASRLWEARI